MWPSGQEHRRSALTLPRESKPSSWLTISSIVRCTWFIGQSHSISTQLQCYNTPWCKGWIPRASNGIIPFSLEYQALIGVSLLLLPPCGLTVAIALITTARPTNGIHFVNEKNACLLGPVVQAATRAEAHTHTPPMKFQVVVRPKTE